MPIARKPKNVTLPANLRERDGYYSWRHPITKQEFGIGRDVKDATRYATEANAKVLAESATSLVDRIDLASVHSNKARHTKPNEHAAAVRKAKTTAFTYAKTRSRMRFGEAGLSRDDFEAMWERSGGRCEVSGIEFDCFPVEGKLKRPWTPSVDRIDNTKGYTPDNCRLICLAVNLAMNEWGEAVLFRIAEALTMHRAKKRRK